MTAQPSFNSPTSSSCATVAVLRDEQSLSRGFLTFLTSLFLLLLIDYTAMWAQFVTAKAVDTVLAIKYVHTFVCHLLCLSGATMLTIVVSASSLATDTDTFSVAFSLVRADYRRSHSGIVYSSAASADAMLK